MARRSGWRRLVLVVVMMLVALPAMAGGRVRGKGGKERGVAAVWWAAVRWVVPAGGLAQWGPGMDPDGLTGGTVPPGGSGRGGDLGPGMDPNG